MLINQVSEIQEILSPELDLLVFEGRNVELKILIDILTLMTESTYCWLSDHLDSRRDICFA